MIIETYYDEKYGVDCLLRDGEDGYCRINDNRCPLCDDKITDKCPLRKEPITFILKEK